MNLGAEARAWRAALAALGVDVIEAGFPIASPGDFEAVRAIARDAARRRASPASRAARRAATSTAPGRRCATRARPRLHVFLATSPIHREYKLRMTRERGDRPPCAPASNARARCATTSSSRPKTRRAPSPTSSPRSPSRRSPPAPRRSTSPTPSATRCPRQYAAHDSHLCAHVRGIDTAVLSASTATTTSAWRSPTRLAAVEAGARQVECTINGIGERAGNCALEEVVMALRTRARRLPAAPPRIDAASASTRPAACVSTITGIAVQRNKAIVGAERLRARSGHPPARHAAASRHLRDHAPRGRRRPAHRSWCSASTAAAHALRARAATSSGTRSTSAALNALFDAFKALADRKKEVFDSDLVALVGGSSRANAGRDWSW